VRRWGIGGIRGSVGDDGGYYGEKGRSVMEGRGGGSSSGEVGVWGRRKKGYCGNEGEGEGG